MLGPKRGLNKSDDGADKFEAYTVATEVNAIDGHLYCNGPSSMRRGDALSYNV